MADHEDHKEKEETLIEKISDKIHARREDSSSSSSDSEDEKIDKTTSFKAKFRRLFGREQSLHKILGGGKTADILLWRNKKTSASVLGGATAIWLLFDVLEYHLLTLVCHGLIFALAVLFLWSNAGFFIKKSRPNIPEVYIPEQPVLEFASALRIEINRVLAALRDIALGRDLKKFLSVIAGLWILSVLGSCCSFLTIFYTTIVLLHTIPMLYEKNEDEVDAFAENAMAELKKLYVAFYAKVFAFAEKAMAELKKQYVVFYAKVLSKIPRGPLRDKKMA